MKRIYLTYDNLAKQDGIGAQLQRILAIYSISKKLRFNYCHSKILRTIEERAHNAASELDLLKLIEQVNTVFELPSKELPKNYTEVKIHSLTARQLAKVVLKTYLRRETTVLRVCLPFGLIEKYPDWYEFAGKELRIREFFAKSESEEQIVVHIRYGYKPIQGKNKGSAPRFLPLEYYPLAVAQIMEENGLDRSVPIVIQTDIPASNGAWRPFQEERLKELQQIGYENQNETFEFERIDLKNQYFHMFPNVTVRYCDPFLDAINEMSTSKYLLMSRSSFSYLAGVINPNKIYIPRLHGHAKLSRWFWDFPDGQEIAIDLLSGI
jgi:hypothetical protein